MQRRREVPFSLLCFSLKWQYFAVPFYVFILNHCSRSCIFEQQQVICSSGSAHQRFTTLKIILLFSETFCGKILMATSEFADTWLFANTWEHLVSWRRLLGQVIIIVFLDAFYIILLDILQDSLVDWSSSLWVRSFFTLNWSLFFDSYWMKWLSVLRCVLHHCAGYFARPIGGLELLLVSHHLHYNQSISALTLHHQQVSAVLNLTFSQSFSWKVVSFVFLGADAHLVLLFSWLSAGFSFACWSSPLVELSYELWFLLWLGISGDLHLAKLHRYLVCSFT
jgi:hypothetical protein